VDNPRISGDIGAYEYIKGTDDQADIGLVILVLKTVAGMDTGQYSLSGTDADDDGKKQESD